MTYRVNIPRTGGARNRARPNRVRARPAEPEQITIDDLFNPPEAPNVDTPLTDILDRIRSASRPGRDSEYVHVSALIHSCMRQLALIEQLERPVPAQQLRLADLLTFRQGEAMAEVIVNGVRDSAPTQLWGNWSCLCKQHQNADPCTYAEATALGACPHCGTLADQYLEVAMHNEDYKIVGRPDLILLTAASLFHITELKSITPNDFPDLTRAKPEHVIQAIFYWWLMRELGFELTSTVSIVYLNKGYSFREAAYREFVVDCASQVARLDGFLEEAAQLKAYREHTAGLPERTRCNTEEDNLARKCHLCQACFSTQDRAPRRRILDLAGIADDGSTPPPAQDRAYRPAERTATPTRATAATRPSRVPGGRPIPHGDRSVTTVNRVRVPPPRRPR